MKAPQNVRRQCHSCDQERQRNFKSIMIDFPCPILYINIRTIIRAFADHLARQQTTGHHQRRKCGNSIHWKKSRSNWESPTSWSTALSAQVRCRPSALEKFIVCQTLILKHISDASGIPCRRKYRL